MILQALAAALLLAQPTPPPTTPSPTPAATPAQPKAPTIHLLRVPDGGIQPQALTDPNGTLHLLYYKGDPKAGDLFYTKRLVGSADFANPIRVNSQPGSAIAIGNDRGGQIALGRGGRVHIAWNGSSDAQPKGPKNPAMPEGSPHNGLPMLYARLNDAGDAFEPQRNLMTTTTALDGGGSVAADTDGNVYVVWHALPLNLDHKGTEQDRRVFIARSTDDGHTFAPEAAISPPELGACGCCGLKSIATGNHGVEILYRAAASADNRDATWLSSRDDGASFTRILNQPWRSTTCPMSTFEAVSTGWDCTLGAWETAGQINVYLSTSVHNMGFPPEDPVTLPGKTADRKYPALAVSKQGCLVAWTEGTAWGRGGSVHWQFLDRWLKPVPGSSGTASGVPAWSLVAATLNPDGSFTLIY